MKNIILLLALFPLFLSCTDDDKEEVKHDYFTDFVTGGHSGRGFASY